jgi:hypothetical protein
VCRQTPAVAPVTFGDVTISGSVRARGYTWDWFGDSADGDYTYPAALVRVGLSRSQTTYAWQVEFALPLLLNLPTTAVAAAPQGQLGLGASYFAGNNNRESYRCPQVFAPQRRHRSRGRKSPESRDARRFALQQEARRLPIS